MYCVIYVAKSSFSQDAALMIVGILAEVSEIVDKNSKTGPVNLQWWEQICRCSGYYEDLLHQTIWNF